MHEEIVDDNEHNVMCLKKDTTHAFYLFKSLSVATGAFLKKHPPQFHWPYKFDIESLSISIHLHFNEHLKRINQSN